MIFDFRTSHLELWINMHMQKNAADHFCLLIAERITDFATSESASTFLN